MKYFALFFFVAVAYCDDGPACLSDERYNCAGSVVPVRDANDCAVFYNCDANIQNPCPSSCPPGLVYNTDLNVCDWETNVSDCPTPAVFFMNDEIEGPACMPEERFDCNGSLVFVRDEVDCATFYECDDVRQQPCPSHCPPGLVFNDVLKVCDWPYDVPECMPSPSFFMDEIIDGPACEPEERFDCQGSLVFVRNDTDCTTFYECDANIQQPCPSHCPAGLVFNTAIQVCDWPVNVPECMPTPSFFNSEIIDGPACEPEERFECQGSLVFVRDDTDCTTFYECDANIQQPCPSHCPAGLVFNTAIQVCDWPINVPECMPTPSFFNSEIIDGPACEPEERFECQGSLVFVRDDTDCTTFYECDANIQQPCPSHCPAGLVFNTAIQVCDWPVNVPECMPTPSFFMDEEIEGPACEPEERYNCNGATEFQRDANDCATFYECDSNIQQPCPSHCPAGLVFNDVLKVCDWPIDVPECMPSPSFFMDEEIIDGPACEPEERYNCNGATEFQRDASDCATFYECDSNIQQPCPSHCPAGLMFNTDILVCDWPQNVQC